MGILLQIVIAALLLQTAAQPQTASIEGRIVSPNGSPVPRADVSVLDPAAKTTGAVSSVTADTEGRFAIAGIKPGVYKVRASREGFTTVEYGQKGANGFGIPLSLGAGQNLKNISITVVSKGEITGRILDRNGMPAVRVGVQALKLLNGDPNQGRRFTVKQVVSTDEEGKFRLFGLTPGEYFVATAPNSSATGLTAIETLRAYVEGNAIRDSTLIRIPKTDGSVQEEVQVPAFYPGIQNAIDASPIQVRGGETVGGIEFSLRYSPVYRIRGIAPNINSMPGFTGVQLIGKQTIGVSLFYSVLVSGEAFEITGVLPGDYRLNGLPIHVGDHDVENIDLRSTPIVPTIRGRVSIDAQAASEIAPSSIGRFVLIGTVFG